MSNPPRIVRCPMCGEPDNGPAGTTEATLAPGSLDEALMRWARVAMRNRQFYLRHSIFEDERLLSKWTAMSREWEIAGNVAYALYLANPPETEG